MEIKEVSKKLTGPYYTRKNLELVLGSNRRSLDYRIKKLISEGVLERVKAGFYLNKRLLSESKEKDRLLEYVGSVLKYPSYVSLEYALSKYGLIPESIYTISYITLKKTDEYSSESVSFKYRNIKKDLFKGYKEVNFDEERYYFAEKYKALFDFIYLTPLKTKKDMEELLFNSRINWDVLDEMDSFREVCMESGSEKMKKVISLL